MRITLPWGSVPTNPTDSPAGTKAGCLWWWMRLLASALYQRGQMIADAILDCSAPGDIVLDNFSGVGSTILAADRVRRACYAIEIDPLYVDTAIRRWEKQTGRQAVLAEKQ